MFLLWSFYLLILLCVIFALLYYYYVLVMFLLRMFCWVVFLRRSYVCATSVRVARCEGVRARRRTMGSNRQRH